MRWVRGLARGWLRVDGGAFSDSHALSSGRQPIGWVGLGVYGVGVGGRWGCTRRWVRCRGWSGRVLRGRLDVVFVVAGLVEEVPGGQDEGGGQGYKVRLWAGRHLNTVELCAKTHSFDKAERMGHPG